MTKLVTVRVVVPCDDGVTTADVQAELTKLLEGQPVTRLEADGAADGIRRMHWSAVAVLRIAERAAPPTPAPTRRKTPVGQGALG
jgi:hypothetical protein